MALLHQIELTPFKNLLTDVENRRTYTLDHCELNVFETYRASEDVQLTFSDVVLTSMVRGKKIMHMPNMANFDYFPGETVLAPAGTKMTIDFPEAKMHMPTQCIALTLDGNTLTKIIDYLNAFFPRFDAESWILNLQTAHLKNSSSLADVLNKMVAVCKETTRTKDVLADLTLKELVVRLVQLQNLAQAATQQSMQQNIQRFYEVLQYIKNNLYGKLDVNGLCKRAYMSRAHFFRCFKQEFGITPVQYIIRERLNKAKELLAQHQLNVQQVSLEAGFDDVNNFIRMFKRAEGLTPGCYRETFFERRQV